MLKFMYQLDCLKVNLLSTYTTSEMDVLLLVSENMVN